jgi:hypothetical protein
MKVIGRRRIKKIAKNVFKELEANAERRSHGCDGCHKKGPTERFDGYCGGHLWLCHTCYTQLVLRGLK